MPLEARVLIVEDLPELAAFEADIVSELGEQAMIALDGAAALALLRTTRFSVILLDLDLPDMKGEDIFPDIAARYATPLPVIVISERAESFTRRSLVAAVLPKPFDLDRLETAIRRILNDDERSPPRSSGYPGEGPIVGYSTTG